jgi:hypothetical protein
MRDLISGWLQVQKTHSVRIAFKLSRAKEQNERESCSALAAAEQR